MRKELVFEVLIDIQTRQINDTCFLHIIAHDNDFLENTLHIPRKSLGFYRENLEDIQSIEHWHTVFKQGSEYYPSHLNHNRLGTSYKNVTKNTVGVPSIIRKDTFKIIRKHLNCDIFSEYDKLVADKIKPALVTDKDYNMDITDMFIPLDMQNYHMIEHEDYSFVFVLGGYIFDKNQDFIWMYGAMPFLETAKKHQDYPLLYDYLIKQLSDSFSFEQTPRYQNWIKNYYSQFGVLTPKEELDPSRENWKDSPKYIWFSEERLEAWLFRKEVLENFQIDIVQHTHRNIMGDAVLPEKILFTYQYPHFKDFIFSEHTYNKYYPYAFTQQQQVQEKEDENQVKKYLLSYFNAKDMEKSLGIKSRPVSKKLKV